MRYVKPYKKGESKNVAKTFCSNKCSGEYLDMVRRGDEFTAMITPEGKIDSNDKWLEYHRKKGLCPVCKAETVEKIVLRRKE